MFGLYSLYSVFARAVFEKPLRAFLQEIASPLPIKVRIIIFFVTALRFINIESSHDDLISVYDPPRALQVKRVLADFPWLSFVRCSDSAFAKLKHRHVACTLAFPD